ncbi:MAG: helix-hairpin-helix domain-containing protein [Clostridiales bacterium]|nr:helix-hairpin-helix domain-containing protein [Clostridiales bacterium]
MQNKKMVYFIMFSLLITSIGIMLILIDKPNQDPIISDKTLVGINSDNITETSSYETKVSKTEDISLNTEEVTESKKETIAKKESFENQTQASIIQIVNLNTAKAEELMSLPNIDSDMAHKILELRDTIQYFSHPYELLYVEGMTEKRLSELIDYITIE